METKKNQSDRLRAFLYIAILIAYPLVRVSQGLYVGDTTYSPANFAFFDIMSGTWTVATYLANAVGHALMYLPFGRTLIGLNIYTSLIVSLTAIIPLLLLKKDLGMNVVLVGELLALGLCWCPTVILYNYLTYLLFTAGALILYVSVRDRKPLLCIAAGVCLGMNVAVRLPNVTESLLIVLVWFAGLSDHERIAELLKKTGLCIAGYLIGFAIPWLGICIRFSPQAYPDMIHNMFSMTDKATDYKPASMITAMFTDYLYAGRWIILWIAGMCICGVVYHVTAKGAGTDADAAGRRAAIIRAAAAVLVFGLVIRLCYGRGMFTLRYYEYGCMYFWAVILLLFVTVCALICVIRPKPVWSDPERYRTRRLLSLLVLLMIYITPIGSNNGLYPTVNNLFITAPYIVWMLWDSVSALRGGIGVEVAASGLRTSARSVVYALTLSVGILCAGTLIQSMGFHIGYAFNDGIYGEPRDSYVTGYESVAGIRTTAHNAETLQGLMDYMSTSVEESRPVILYGDIPGMGYLLDRPSALGTFWPDLDSYNYEEWSADMSAVYDDTQSASADSAGDESALPAIIVTLPVAALEGQDQTAIEYFGAEAAKYEDDAKLTDLISVIHDRGYVQTYANDAYAVYLPR